MMAAIIAEVEHDREAALEAIRERYNCREVEVDESGGVWIADPQRGHWLTSEQVQELVSWGVEHHGWRGSITEEEAR